MASPGDTEIKVTPELTRTIAALARIRLTDEEVAQFTPQLESILAYFRELDALDTTGVEPLISPIDLESVLREDEVVPFESPGEIADSNRSLKITASAPDVMVDGYRVPPVL